MNRNYITCPKEYKGGFLTIPCSLFTNPVYSKLSSEAKLLYGHLLSLSGLSLKNHLTDQDGRAYVFFSRAQAQELIGCGENTATKIFRELSSCGLIDDIPQGKKKANKIYVKYPEDVKPDEQARKRAKAEKKTHAKKARETLKRLNASIKAKREIERSLSLRIQEKRRQLAVDQALEITPETVLKIREQIEYHYFISNAESLHISPAWVDTIVLSMAEMQTAFYTKINGCMLPWNELKKVLGRYDSSYLLNFIEYFRQNVCIKNIRNLKAYLKTTLYNFIQQTAAEEQGWEFC